mgnify:CR=1 FL=1
MRKRIRTMRKRMRRIRSTRMRRRMRMRRMRGTWWADGRVKICWMMGSHKAYIIGWLAG